jgi:type IV secretory pathway VirB9-like protein
MNTIPLAARFAIAAELIQTLHKILLLKAAGQSDAASAWAAELVRLLGCHDIINTRGRELRRDFHAGPRDALKWLAVAAALGGLASPALAVQQCKANKKDPRVWECYYDPNDIYKAWSAPGSELMIRLAPDEQIFKIQAADSDTIQAGWSDNIATFKFVGCALPEPTFIASHKAASDEIRTYTFQLETVPRVCARGIPQQQPQPDPNVAAAAYTDGAHSSHVSLLAAPNLQHLEHPSDLAEGGQIPYIITIKYPSDEKAKRDAAWLGAAKRFQRQQAEKLLADAAAGRAGTTGFLNTHYYGKGAADLKPCLECGPTDDGNKTTVFFPGQTPIPAFTKLGNVTEGCGDTGQESVADSATHSTTRMIAGRDTQGSAVSLNGTAPGWCMRLNGRVYQLTNSSYNPVGYPTGTQTITRDAVRVMKGGHGN